MTQPSYWNPRHCPSQAWCLFSSCGGVAPLIAWTYCAVRLQTPDGGAPVLPFTVGREFGHGGDASVRKVCQHLGTVRDGRAAVEYREEQHAATLGDRVAVLHGAAS